MRALFDSITRLSLRFRWITVVLTVLLMVGGFYSFIDLNQELLPDIEFPQTFVIVRNDGATSDQVLAMYSVPIEDGAEEVNGVVNIETISNEGFGFAIIRNEFGEDQDQIVEDIRTQLDAIPLPVRSLVPPEGTTPAEMINELSPEAVLWLYEWSEAENSGFVPQMSREVLQAFAPESLAVLPPEAFEDLDSELRAAVAPESQVELALPEQPPALPESWSGDPRFSTVEDLAELSDARDSLADVFNDFYEDERLIGPLVKVTDLTAADVEIFLAVEESCRALDRPERADGSDPCSFVAELNAATVLALPDDILAVLPDDYLEQLSLIDRNDIAAVRVSEALSGQMSSNEGVELPDAWQVEAPEILTFNFSDFALGTVSVNSESLTEDELRQFVENEMLPRLRDTELIADVGTVGGEIIPARIQNEARALYGLEPLEVSEEAADADSEAAEDVAESAPAGISEEQPDDEEPAPQQDDSAQEIPEGPQLDVAWSALAGLTGLDAFDTADDIFKVIGTDIQGVEIESAAGFINALGEQETAAFLLDSLSPEILDFLAANEAGFYNNVNPAILTAISSPGLGEAWTQLSAQPVMGDTPLTNVSELQAAGAVETINTIVDTARANGSETYAIQLMDSLTPESIEALAAENPDFLNEIAASNPDALRFLSRDAIRTVAVSRFMRSTDDDDLAADLRAILDGAPTAAESQLAGSEVEAFVDPNAPVLPASWPGVAPFVGANELDTADDLFNVPGYATPADLISGFASGQQGQGLVRDLQAEHWFYLAEQQESFWTDLNASAIRLINLESINLADLPPDVQARIASQGEPYEPEETVTRTDFNPSLLVEIYKEDAANTVNSWTNSEEVLNEVDAQDDITVDVVFEQASFITNSLEGVTREGLFGGAFAIVMILIFMNLSFRSTAVVAISIPGSIMFAFILIQLVPGNVHSILEPIVRDTGRESTLGSILTVVLRLFPETFTLNLMTLSGMTVAIGRVVDDSIVVLENIYRNIGLTSSEDETLESREDAIANGTREVSVAIFAATLTTMVIFLPLGLFGGVTGAFFLPFGLTVAYALIGSFVVSITIVPVLASFFITRDSIPAEGTIDITDDLSAAEKGWARFANIFIGAVEWLGRAYAAIIEWALRGWNRAIVLVVAIVMFFVGMMLLGSRPAQFLPALGDPTITTTVTLPTEFEGQPITIARTNALVNKFEEWIAEQQAEGAGITTVQVTVGSVAGFDFGPDQGVNETGALILMEVTDTETKDALVPVVREQAELIFNDLNNNGELDYQENGEDGENAISNVSVSGADLAGGDFGGFALEVKAADPEVQPSLAELRAYNETVLTALNNVEGLVNVELENDFGDGSDSAVYIRIDGETALRYVGEVESEDTLGVAALAIDEAQVAVDELFDNSDELTVPVQVAQGFESQQQEEGVAEIIVSMGIASVIAIVLLALTFRHIIIPFEIFVSLPLSFLGAGVALTVTDRVLGLPALVGLLMLIGIVLTNAIVLLDRVQQNRREKHMSIYDALVEAGETRLRPILMTAATTTIAQLPLAASSESGAIIAAELATVVIGGLVSSTALTLIVLPVIFSLVHGFIQWLLSAIGMGGGPSAQASAAD